MRALVVFALLAACVPCLSAQRPPVVSGTGFRSFPHHRSFFAPPVFFADSFYSDALYNPGYPVASQPPIIMLQAPLANSAPEPPATPAQPLMIELQGDRYVRVSGEGHSGPEIVDEKQVDDKPLSAHRSPTRSSPIQSSPPQRPAPARLVVLVFRDGHQEEASSYTIANGILYASANYYTDGSWNRQINLKSLNLPETITANQSRGISFHLPSAPNEVIVGP